MSNLPIPSFAVIEIAIALYGIFSIFILRWGNSYLHSLQSVGMFSHVVDLLLNTSMLIVPTFLMGVSTPAFFQAIKRVPGNAGVTFGVFYGANVLGAALGAIISGTLLIELLGLWRSTLFAAGLNCIAAIISLLAARRKFSTETSNEFIAPLDAGNPSSGIPINLIGAGVLLGFVSLAFEIVGFRVVTYNFTLISYVFPFSLSAFLINMSLGNTLGGALARRLRAPLILPTLLLLVGSSLVFVFSYLPMLVESPSESTSLNLVMSYALLFFIPTLFISCFLPILIERSSEHVRLLSSNAATFLFALTLSNAAGGILTQFFLLEYMGTIQCVRLIIALTALATILIELNRYNLLAALVSLYLLTLVPGNYYESLEDIYVRVRPTEAAEDRYGVLTTVKTSDDEQAFRLFRTPTANVYTTLNNARAEETSLWNFSSLIVGATFQPRKVLTIGLGNVMVVYGLSRFSFVESITVVELLPTVLKAVLKHAAVEIKEALQSNRVTLKIDDGRRYVSRMPSSEKYDLVELGVFHPWTAGAANLYTVEFFNSLKNILNENGVLGIHRYYPLADEAAFTVFPFAYKIDGDFGSRFHLYSARPISWNDAPTLKVNLRLCEQAYIKSGKINVLQAFRERMPSQLNTDDTPILEYFLYRNNRFASAESLSELSPIIWRSIKEMTIECQ